MLRQPQVKLKAEIYQAWDSGDRVVMPVAPTGFGKTVVISSIITERGGYSTAIAHRQELVSQISTALARNGVRHRLITNNKVLIRTVSAIHVMECGRSFIDHNSRVGVGGVDTIGRMSDTEPLFAQSDLVTIDEGHHVLRENKWGRVWSKFKKAKGLLPSATPQRADGMGLGAHADGVVNRLVLAPSMRETINSGYLTDYKIYCPPSGLRVDDITIGANGDFNQKALSARVADSQIVGDVVDSYLKIAPGKLGVTFAVDIKEAEKITLAFNQRGISAQLVTSETPDEIRAAINRKFKNRDILQLVNVDLFGEGYDLPALEVVSFARPTQSFALYTQQFGRVLRLFLPDQLVKQWPHLNDQQRLHFIAQSSKPYGIVIDHVNNVLRHNGPPDRPIVWSLDRREKRSAAKSDAIPYRVCPQCTQPFERIFKECPHCGYYAPPQGRSLPEMVDGDLHELDPEILRAMRGEISRIDGPFYAPASLPPHAVKGAANRHYERQNAQWQLRNSIAWWAGLEALHGRSESESYRRFYFKYGIDIASAQALGRPEAEDLALRINLDLAKVGIDGMVNHEDYIK